ncbi:MAG: hypothetical protein ACXVUE_20485 [Solirubrobacteraceae bacterium]
MLGPRTWDAPIGRYLSEAYNVEIASQQLRGVHGAAASVQDTGVVFAGMGGEISDDPNEVREEDARMRYPRWEAEYRLKVLGEFDYNELVMLFATPPAHKGLSRPGSEAVAELVNTYRPRLVVCGGEPGVETLGKSVTVAPGDLADGCYALADLRHREAKLEELAGAAP